MALSQYLYKVITYKIYTNEHFQMKNMNKHWKIGIGIEIICHFIDRTDPINKNSI